MKRSPFLSPLILSTPAVGALSLVAVCWGAPTLAQAQISGDAIRQASETCAQIAAAKGFTVERLSTFKIESVTDATGQIDPTLARINVVLDLTRADGPQQLTCPLTVSSVPEPTAIPKVVPPVTTVPPTASDTEFRWWWLLPLLIGLPVLLWLLLKGQRSAQQPLVGQPTGAIASQSPAGQTEFTVPAAPANHDPSLQADTTLHSTVTPQQHTLPKSAETAHGGMNGATRGVGVERRAIAHHNATANATTTTIVQMNGLTGEQESLQTGAAVMPQGAAGVTLMKRQIPRQTVRIHKRVETREEVVATPILHEKAVVEQIPINQYISGDIPTMREEEGVVIVPIVEEVTIAEKRLLLREEVRVVKQRTVQKSVQSISPRREIGETQRSSLEAGAPLQAEVKLYKNASPNGDDEHHASIDTNQVWTASNSQDDSKTNSTKNQLGHHPANSTVAFRVLNRNDAVMQRGDSFINSNEINQVNPEIGVPEGLTSQTQQSTQPEKKNHKRVEIREEQVETPIIQERIVVERIPINQYLTSEIPKAREEDGILIIPLLEEVTVTEKRLLLREEIRIYKQRTPEDASKKLTLRREFVEIERLPLDAP
ncbi:MAG TPA: DUF2382 domain-containing protein [Synechococcales cyanobacterium M55_K2018_004]|nr:DUF2382 domain-containing protein [Synechococcales cyanobacterium M55_K2018_004]